MKKEKEKRATAEEKNCEGREYKNKKKLCDETQKLGKAQLF